MRRTALAMFFSLLLLSTTANAQLQRYLDTDKGASFDTPVPHPLSWWTTDPLRLDADGDLMLGYILDNGAVVKTSDYRVQQTVAIVGSVAGSRVVQILDSFHARPGLRDYGAGFGGPEPTVWKSLLVRPPGSSNYIEIYRLQAFSGPKSNAQIYDTGDSAILGTDDSDGGNGGSCADGYWWFDKAGPHRVDFTPLNAAMHKAAPPESTFTTGCWTMHPADSYIQTWVQAENARCHAYGGLGELHAEYAIRHGVAEAANIVFKPEPQQ